MRMGSGAPAGIRTRVPDSTGLDDRPLHYRGVGGAPSMMGRAMPERRVPISSFWGADGQQHDHLELVVEGGVAVDAPGRLGPGGHREVQRAHELRELLVLR